MLTKRLKKMAEDASAKERWIAEELKKQDDNANLALGLELGCEWANDVYEFTEENLNSVLQNMCQNFEQAFAKGWASTVNYSDNWFAVETDENIASFNDLSRVINYEDLADKLMQNPQTTENVPQSVIKVLNEE